MPTLHIVPDKPMFTTLESTLASPEDDTLDLLAEHIRAIHTASEKYMVLILNSQAISSRQELGIDVEAKVKIGGSVDKGVEYANENKVDLIVV